MNAVTEVKATSHLMYLAGVLNAARVDLLRVESNPQDYPADTYPEVLAAAREELAVAEREYSYEWQALEVLQSLEAAPVAVKPKKERCAHWKLIKRFFAIAREKGLDTSKAAKPRMRHAMESAMNRCVDSRSEVSAGEWQMLGDRVKAGLLTW